MRNVIYAVDEEGYTVAVLEEGKILHLYGATNNPLDSQGPVLAEGVPLGTLRRWARETAEEMAREWGAEMEGPSEDAMLRGGCDGRWG